jgi:hypothetical protein
MAGDSGFSIFGFTINRKKEESDLKKTNRIEVPSNDGSITVDASNLLGSSMHNAFSWDAAALSNDNKTLIETYRNTAQISECDFAINEVVNEAIVVDNDNVVEIQLDETTFSASVRDKISEEFEYLTNIIDFESQGDQIFRQWYIDGRQVYHKVINSKRPQEGIQDLTWLDPIRVDKIKEIKKRKESGTEVIDSIEEYFIYKFADNDQKRLSPFYSTSPEQKALRIAADSISYTTSGKIDLKTGRVLSHLHKAIKPSNQLALLEDSAVVYRLVRAPERKVYYVDVGKLAPGRAEQYLSNLMNQHRNRLVYNAEDGVVDAHRVQVSMSEDIWLPRQEGRNGTEVEVLSGGANLGEIEDILYFRRKLYKALNVPISRMESEATVSIGVSNEITRDELRFTKYVESLLRRFNGFWYDVLKTQLILKKIITEDDWEENKGKIFFKYNKDSHFTELKNAEIMSNRLELLSNIADYAVAGQYFSKNWVRKNVLMMNEDEIEQITKDWEEEEKENDKYQDQNDDSGFGGGFGSQSAEEEQDNKPEPEEKDDSNE